MEKGIPGQHHKSEGGAVMDCDHVVPLRLRPLECSGPGFTPVGFVLSLAVFSVCGLALSSTHARKVYARYARIFEVMFTLVSSWIGC